MKENCNHKNSTPESAAFTDPSFTDPYLAGSVSSDTECTGLMPTPPASDAELESYKEMYPFSPAQVVPVNRKEESDS